MSSPFWVLLTAASVFSVPARAAPQVAPDGGPPALQAVRLDAGEEITLDGYLEEGVWQRAQPASDFKQSDPDNGAPATEVTEVRVVFSRDNLYIGVQLFDAEPNGVLANQMVRDGPLGADDRFMWVLDPFDDQRSGYFFEVNPAGAMGDAQLVPAQGGGSFGTTQNRSWNGIWLARVRRHEEGWTAEIEIPFRTLDFNPDVEAWGANFQRIVRRKNEEALWSGWGRNQGIFSLTGAGRIEGIRDVSQGLGLDVKPYFIGTYSEAPSLGTPSTYKGEAGGDFFYSLTPQLKASFTFNTDFAQTEVDDRQVNLTRFPLFFPEKRDFFLEGSGYYDFSRESSRNLTAFFTRRIGLTEGGQPQKIDYGVKMGGQIGRFDLGVMQVRTAEEFGASGEDFTVFRPKRRFLNQSYAGLIYTRRSTRNSNVADRHTVGADFELATSRFRGDQNLQLSGFFMKTPTSAKGTDNAAWGFRLSYPNDLWNARIAYKEFRPDVDPALGFVGRTNYKKWTPVLLFSPRPADHRWIRQVSIGARGEFYSDMNGQALERFVQFTPIRVDLHSGDSASVTITPTYEFLEGDFRISPGIILPETSEYRYTRYSFQFRTANRRKVAVNTNLTVGTFYSGHRRDVSAEVNLRPRRGLLATFSTEFNRVELREGSFSTKILRTIINTQFSPFVSISNNVQYDSVSRVLGWQSRFRWIVNPGNDVYLVWMNNWLDSEDGLATIDRNAAAKMVYTYRF